jgi:hypothetical protein
MGNVLQCMLPWLYICDCPSAFTRLLRCLGGFQMANSEMHQRYYLVSSHRRDVPLARAVIGILGAMSLMGSAVTAGDQPVGYNTLLIFRTLVISMLLGLLTQTVGVTTIFCYITLVHTVERALFELDDTYHAHFSRSPGVRLVLPSASIICFICHEDVCAKQAVAGHHPSDRSISRINLNQCKVYHQPCLVQWWRNDRTKIGQCPECTTVPQWSRFVFTATSR